MSASLRAVAAVITPKRFLLALFIVPLALYVFKEVTRDVLIIEAFSVPREFQDRGLTGEVFANRVGLALDQIEKGSNSSAKKDRFSSARDAESVLPIEIPETKLSLKTLVDATRQIVGRHPIRIAGDIYLLDGKGEPSATSASVTVYLRQGRDTISTRHLDSLPPADYETLILRTAETVLRQTNPYLLASYMEEVGRWQEALEIVSRQAEVFGGTQDQKVRSLNLWGHLLVTHGQNNADLALAKFEEAVAIDPGSALTFDNWGGALATLQRREEAREKYRKALALDPGRASTHYNLGLLLVEMRELSQAIQEIERAIDLDPKDANAHVALGNVLADKRDFYAAISHYREAIRLAPNSALAYNNLGLAFIETKQPKDAVAQFRRAIEIDSGFGEAYLNLAGSLRTLNKHEEASSVYEQASKLKVVAADANLLLGVLLLDREQFNPAIEKLVAAVNLGHKEPEVHKALGLAYFGAGRREQAVSSLQQAIQLGQQDADTYFVLYDALLVLGRYDEADAALKKAKESEKSK